MSIGITCNLNEEPVLNFMSLYSRNVFVGIVHMINNSWMGDQVSLHLLLIPPFFPFPYNSVQVRT